MSLDKDIIISGISGRFPECHNVDELGKALLAGEDLITENDDRFPAGLNGIPKRQGKVPNIDKFDASFFGFHSKQAHFTDPRQRILLETTYEAIIDAGYNPSELRGSKTGVFVALSVCTNFNEIISEDNSGYSMLGASHLSAANRISYCFDFTGPSYVLDTGCSSSLYAFSQAVDCLNRGEIKYAIVGAPHVILNPIESLQLHNLTMLSPEGKSKAFNKDRNGFVRSDGICSYFLQKKKDCKRIYALVVGAKTNTEGYSKEGYTVPSAEMQFRLCQELYHESNVNTKDVSYVEMHAAGTKVGDRIECQAIADMFCKDRETPLLVGSIKSNMGHCETTAGLAAITKVLLAMETEIIPANIYFDPLDEDLPGIKNKQLEIITSNTKWKPSIVGINSFGFGGANAHVILKSITNRKTSPIVTRKHRLVQVSGRTEEAVNYFLQQIQNNPNDTDFLSLVDEIHKSNIYGHHFRGYTVLGQKSIQQISTYTSEKRPIWFIYSGMGSQWPGMAKDLMNIEAFRNTFNRCATAVKPYGIDLVNVILNPSELALQSLDNCFCALIAIAVSLTDLLACLGIKPDYFAGHSLGETGCAYANGDLTPEQTVLLAYSKYYAIKQQKLPNGQMAVIGLPKDELQKILPNNVFVACENGLSNITISGLEQDVKDFVERLTKQNVFARLISTTQVAFHSKYLMDSDKHLLDFTRKIIIDPKPRLDTWISTSVTSDKMQEDWATKNCAEYHTNSYKNKVVFDQIYKSIQPNAIVVEIAPHGILGSVFKKELGPGNTIISLLDKNSNCQEECLLSSIGRIFNAGGQPNLRNLYNETVFPVNRGTKMLAPMVKWDHSTSWFVPYYKKTDSFGKIVKINLSDEKYSYLKGHNINGEIIMPAAAYLEMLWKIRTEMSLKDFTNSCVVFENITFSNYVTLPENEDVEFLINIIKESDHFEIFRDGSQIVSGTIKITGHDNDEFKAVVNGINVKPELVMKREDFYKEAHLRSYYYWNNFQGIAECDVNILNAKIEWFDNYVSFLDSMLQLSIIGNTSRKFLIPFKIKKLVIDPKVHNQESLNKYIEVIRDPYCNVIKTKGIQIVGLKLKTVPLIQKPQLGLVLETFKFINFDSPKNDAYDFNTSLIIVLQIVIQNTRGGINKLTLGEVKETEEVTNTIKEIISTTEIKYSIIKTNNIKQTTKKFDVIIPEKSNNDFQKFENILNHNGFFIYIGDINQTSHKNVDVIFRSSKISLVRFKHLFPTLYDTINIRNSDFKWLDKLKQCIKSTSETSIFLFSQNEDLSGIIGLHKYLMTENIQVEIQTFFINNQKVFSVDDKFYRHQISKCLTLNVLGDDDCWGTFVYLPLEEFNLNRYDNASLSIKNVGDLSTLLWIETPVKKIQRECEIIEVHYSTLTSTDSKIVTAQTTIESDKLINFGMEYSGVTESNRKVMGVVKNGSISLEINSLADFTWDVPKYWSLKDAATVPLAYIISYYGLVIKGKIKQNNSILILNAASDIGIAAISIALRYNTTIFAFVNSVEKQKLLKQLYPQLDLFIDDVSLIQKKTKGKGVDFIINNFGEEYLEKSLNCLAKGGKFLQVGNVDGLNEIFIDSDIFFKECYFYWIKLEDIFDEISEIRKHINILVKTGIESGVVKPIPSTSFEPLQIESAFKYLLTEKYIGKILIKLRGEEHILAYPQLYLNFDKSYIIIGGLDGIGLELTSWLIQKGAKKIILNSRSDISNGYQLYSMKKWSELKDVVVKINLSDITTLNGAEDLIKYSEEFGPVGGIFTAEGANIVDQTDTKLEKVFKSKLISGQNMDVVTRNYCPLLDHFVVFSSILAGMGHSEYGMANSALERLCEKRKRENLPAIAVQWGPVGDVGFLATTDIEQKMLNLTPQRIGSCFDTLERFILQKVTVGASTVLTPKKVESNKERSYVKIVADILGIKNFDSVDKRATLSQLGLDSLMMAEIKHALYRESELDLEPEDIIDLTFEYLINLQTGKKTFRPAAIKKFPPPILAESPILKMNSSQTKENNKILFMIHPIEGHLHYLLPLAKRLSINVYGLQSSKSSNFKTIEDTAKYSIKLIRSVQKKGPYYICGYSYGAALAFEIGLELEKEGEEVELVAIDGAPDYARLMFSDKNDLNENIIKFYSSLFKEVNLDKIKPIISKYNNSEDSISSIFEFISQETGLKLADISDAGEQYFNRCRALFDYKPKGTFNGQIKLIRRLQNHQAKSDDYGFQKICSKTVKVIKFNGDHTTILFGKNLEKLSKIINEWMNK